MFNWQELLLQQGWTQDGNYFTYPYPGSAEAVVLVISEYLPGVWKIWTYLIDGEEAGNHMFVTKTTFIEFVEAIAQPYPEAYNENITEEVNQ